MAEINPKEKDKRTDGYKSFLETIGPVLTPSYLDSK